MRYLWIVIVLAVLALAVTSCPKDTPTATNENQMVDPSGTTATPEPPAEDPAANLTPTDTATDPGAVAGGEATPPEGGEGTEPAPAPGGEGTEPAPAPGGEGGEPAPAPGGEGGEPAPAPEGGE